jgi:predicted lipoprotein with Yx(FWY)xxD motif
VRYDDPLNDPENRPLRWHTRCMRRHLLVLSVVLLSLAALPAPAMAQEPSRDTSGTVEVRPSRYGEVLVDGKGFVLYLFTRDGRSASRCSGACAKAWPPMLVEGRPRAGRGARRGLLGTTRRRDGSRQVTYRGRPLYYYVADRRPGQILCQAVPEFGGTWFLVGPDGRANRRT